MILGVGCDIVKIDRLIEKQEMIALKVLTTKEKEIYDAYQGHRKVEFLAGRFVCKEAIFKAIPNHDIVLSQIEIINNEVGKPICHLLNYQLHISIAHEKEYAMAYVICEE